MQLGIYPRFWCWTERRLDPDGIHVTHVVVASGKRPDRTEQATMATRARHGYVTECATEQELSGAVERRLADLRNAGLRRIAFEARNGIVLSFTLAETVKGVLS